MMNQETARLGGKWTHSFEEDEGDVRLYRPTDSFPFPPSRRGRETLAFGPDAQVLRGMPGPDDRQRVTSSGMTALGMNRFRLDAPEANGSVIEIVEAKPDLLKLRFV
ncbi:hypothetical protein AAKU55_001893 [Oxalobacteraceae bacterium GrIS 1.11]